MGSILLEVDQTHPRQPAEVSAGLDSYADRIILATWRETPPRELLPKDRRQLVARIVAAAGPPPTADLDAAHAEEREARTQLAALRRCVERSDAVDFHRRSGEHSYCHGCDLASALSALGNPPGKPDAPQVDVVAKIVRELRTTADEHLSAGNKQVANCLIFAADRIEREHGGRS